MTNLVHLDSSLTLVPAAILKPGPKSVIGSDVFGSADQHLIIRDADLTQALRDFAMREGMAVATIPVGSSDEKTPVEFFYLDVKKNKKEMAKLSKLLGRAWLEVIQEAELARDEADGNLLSPDVTGPLDNVENMIAVRRFISNGTDPSMLAKKKRTILLFHHSVENAPRPA
jgi:hypothetical protein